MLRNYNHGVVADDKVTGLGSKGLALDADVGADADDGAEKDVVIGQNLKIIIQGHARVSEGRFRRKDLMELNADTNGDV